MTYALVAIVKNEEERIGTLLDSVAPYVVHATFIDTGSTDDTVGRIKRHPVPSTVLVRPWINFGHNRSEAFAKAAGTADWLLALDADMTVEIDPDFEPDPAVDAYLIEMGSGDFSYRLPLLLRSDRQWISRGAVHEYTLMADGSIGRREPTDKVRVTHHGEGRSSREKTQWHVELLEADLARDPDNPRTVFYLAQSLRELGDPRALEMYRKRATMGGFAEEAFYAAYRAALLEPEWPQRAAALLAAWEMRPHRLEPLHALVSEMNRRDMHNAAYRLSDPTVSSWGDPPADLLFVHRDVWDWGMAFERHVAAWWVGQQNESRQLGELLLRRSIPDHIRAAILRNLSFTEEAAA